MEMRQPMADLPLVKQIYAWESIHKPVLFQVGANVHSHSSKAIDKNIIFAQFLAGEILKYQ